MQCVACGAELYGNRNFAGGDLCKVCRKAGRGPAKEPVMANPRTPDPPAAPPPTPALPPLPEGFRYVYNRTDHPYTAQFDMNLITFQPHETRMVACGVAEAIRDWSVINGTVRAIGQGTLKGERALALGPGWSIANSHKLDDESWSYEYVAADPEEHFLRPTTTENGPEWFDRESIPNYVNRPSRENVPTTAKLIRV